MQPPRSILSHAVAGMLAVAIPSHNECVFISVVLMPPLTREYSLRRRVAVLQRTAGAACETG